MVPGKRYSVFAIRTVRSGETIWIKAGFAFVQPDDSMNLTLDVLPLDGKLHIREVQPKYTQQSNHNPRREEPATAPPLAASPQSMGGH